MFFFYIKIEIDIISDFVSGSCLKEMIDIFGIFEESMLNIFAKQILEGLNFLHKNGIVHGYK